MELFDHREYVLSVEQAELKQPTHVATWWLIPISRRETSSDYARCQKIRPRIDPDSSSNWSRPVISVAAQDRVFDFSSRQWCCCCSCCLPSDDRASCGGFSYPALVRL